MKIKFSKAKISDLKFIIELLLEDDLGKSRESTSKASLQIYKKAFLKITKDKNQFLMI